MGEHKKPRLIDQVGAAIASVKGKEAEHAAAVEAAQSAPAPMARFNMTLSSGRPAYVGLGPQMTDRDWLDLIGIVMTQVRPAHIRMTEQRAAEVETPIIVPSRVLVGLDGGPIGGPQADD